MSIVRADSLKDRAGVGAPSAPNGMNVTGVCTATTFSGSGASLTSIPAGNLTGTVADARISTLTASKLTGALPAISGANLTGISAGTYSVHNVQSYSIARGTNTQYTGGRTDYVDIAQGNYMTFTITSTNDYIVFNWSIETYQPNNNHGIATYIMYHTTSSITSSSTKLRYVGQHSMYGNMNHMNLSQSSWVTGLSAGTYYFELAGASHANNSNRADFGHTNTNQGTDGNHFVVGVHYKKE